MNTNQNKVPRKTELRVKRVIGDDKHPGFSALTGALALALAWSLITGHVRARPPF